MRVFGLCKTQLLIDLSDNIYERIKERDISVKPPRVSKRGRVTEEMLEKKDKLRFKCAL